MSSTCPSRVDDETMSIFASFPQVFRFADAIFVGAFVRCTKADAFLLMRFCPCNHLNL
jgi:hypothetical protein